MHCNNIYSSDRGNARLSYGTLQIIAHLLKIYSNHIESHEIGLFCELFISLHSPLTEGTFSTHKAQKNPLDKLHISGNTWHKLNFNHTQELNGWSILKGAGGGGYSYGDEGH